MPNHLANETSPYLLQHATNPVDWYPWGQEALELALREDKPIFLSIGYAACHWCHVMAHESFEDPEIAKLLNQNFICIKVDREERPDLDSIYMKAVMTMTDQGGWPMSMFITPDGQPFYGGTYFPPDHRYNLPSFRDVLEGVDQAWRTDRSRLQAAASQITNQLRQDANLNLQGPMIDLHDLEKAREKLLASYDWKQGGWGSAPKFPQPMAIEFLLRQGFRGDQPSLDVTNHALEAMSRGGMYDLVGGGFHRYSTDVRWLVPHFEKMLYDNAQLAQVYLHAYCLTGDPAWRRVCEATLDFIGRELTGPQGGFYSSLDADSAGGEGSFYIWSFDELKSLLGSRYDFPLIAAAFGVTEAGNFEGSNILQRKLHDEELAGRFSISPEEVRARLEAMLGRLLKERAQRVRPATDDKVLTAWNALALQAYAEAARILNRTDYLGMATRNAAFILDKLYTSQLFRSWRSGQAQHPAYLEDFAGLILGLLAVYQADPQPRWFSAAVRLAAEMVDRFSDPQGGFFDTGIDQKALLLRPKDIQDNATPSGNALAVNALLHLAAFTENAEWRRIAEETAGALQATVARYPTAFAYWLSAMDFAIGPVQQIALISAPGDPGLKPLADTAWQSYHPRRVIAASAFPPEDGAPALLKDREPVNGYPTAFVCESFTCRLPTTSPAELKAQLDQARQKEKGLVKPAGE